MRLLRLSWTRNWMSALSLALVALACDSSHPPASSQKSPQSQTAAQPSPGKEGTEVTLCDGETTTTAPANMERTRENGVKISDALMAQWKRKHPDTDWVAQEREK